MGKNDLTTTNRSVPFNFTPRWFTRFNLFLSRHFLFQFNQLISNQTFLLDHFQLGFFFLVYYSFILFSLIISCTVWRKSVAYSINDVDWFNQIIQIILVLDLKKKRNNVLTRWSKWKISKLCEFCVVEGFFLNSHWDETAFIDSLEII